MANLRSCLYLICCGILQLGVGQSAETVSKDLMVTSVERSIDISSQLIKVNTKLTLSNEGQATLKFFHFTVEDGAFSKISYIGASVSNWAIWKFFWPPNKIESLCIIFNNHLQILNSRVVVRVKKATCAQVRLHSTTTWKDGKLNLTSHWLLTRLQQLKLILYLDRL